jgi:hypothetical protein
MGTSRDPPGGLSPEERRLRDYVEDEETAGGWPEHLPLEHPDLFPVHRKSPEPPADPRAVRLLLLVTVPTVVLLLVAQVTGTLMGNAWLVALLVALAGFSFHQGFLLREPVFWYLKETAQGAFVGALLLIGVASFFGVREHRTVGELAAVMEPVPGITGVTYVPTEEELAAIQKMIQALSTFSTGEGAGAPFPVERTGTRYWILRTDLGVDDAIAFYRSAEHRPGWELDTRTKGLFVFHRGGDRMLVFVRDDWPRPETSVFYAYTPASRP